MAVTHAADQEWEVKLAHHANELDVLARSLKSRVQLFYRREHKMTQQAAQAAAISRQVVPALAEANEAVQAEPLVMTSKIRAATNAISTQLLDVQRQVREAKTARAVA